MTWYRVKYSSGRFNNECETPCSSCHGAVGEAEAGRSCAWGGGGAAASPSSKVTKLTTTVSDDAICRLICSGTEYGAVHVAKPKPAAPPLLLLLLLLLLLAHAQIGP